jgi:hypothetical protein
VSEEFFPSCFFLELDRLGLIIVLLLFLGRWISLLGRETPLQNNLRGVYTQELGLNGEFRWVVSEVLFVGADNWE